MLSQSRPRFLIFLCRMPIIYRCSSASVQPTTIPTHTVVLYCHPIPSYFEFELQICVLGSLLTTLHLLPRAPPSPVQESSPAEFGPFISELITKANKGWWTSLLQTKWLRGCVTHTFQRWWVLGVGSIWLFHGTWEVIDGLFHAWYARLHRNNRKWNKSIKILCYVGESSPLIVAGLFLISVSNSSFHFRTKSSGMSTEALAFPGLLITKLWRARSIDWRCKTSLSSKIVGSNK